MNKTVTIYFKKIETCFVELQIDSEEEAQKLLKEMFDYKGEMAFISSGECDISEESANRNSILKKMTDAYIDSGNLTVNNGDWAEYELE